MWTKFTYVLLMTKKLENFLKQTKTKQKMYRTYLLTFITKPKLSQLMKEWKCILKKLSDSGTKECPEEQVYTHSLNHNSLYGIPELGIVWSCSYSVKTAPQSFSVAPVMGYNVQYEILEVWWEGSSLQVSSRHAAVDCRLVLLRVGGNLFKAF